MKKIGRQTLYREATEQEPRSGEGCFIRLKDGGILYAYNRFRAGAGDDYDSADIAGIKSSDEGESWSEPFILIKKDECATNLMCPSLIRMKNGDIGMIYIRKYTEKEAGNVLDNHVRPFGRRRGTWSEGADILKRGGSQLKTPCITLERQIYPFNRHSEKKHKFESIPRKDGFFDRLTEKAGTDLRITIIPLPITAVRSSRNDRVSGKLRPSPCLFKNRYALSV